MGLKKHTGKTIGLVLVGICSVAWLIKAPIASWYLSKMAQVPISVLNINIWPSELTIYFLKIKNPPQFGFRRAMEVKRIAIDYDSKKVLANPVEINRVHLEDVFLRIDSTNSSGTENNWTAIRQKMQQANESSTKGMFIHQLIIDDLTVEIQGIYGGPKRLKFAHIELENLGSDSGFPVSAIVRGIAQQSDFKPEVSLLIDDAINLLFN